MTPADHYAEAERLVHAIVAHEPDGTPPAGARVDHEYIRDVIALAGAHIGLAYVGSMLAPGAVVDETVAAIKSQGRVNLP